MSSKPNKERYNENLEDQGKQNMPGQSREPGQQQGQPGQSQQKDDQSGQQGNRGGEQKGGQG